MEKKVREHTLVLFLTWNKVPKCYLRFLKTYFHFCEMSTMYLSTWVPIFLLLLIQSKDCGFSLEPPRCVPTIKVLSKNIENIIYFPMEVSFFTADINSVYCLGMCK